MKKIKEYIDKSYGTGNNVPWYFPVISLTIGIIIGIAIILFNPQPNNDIPLIIHQIFKWYLVILSFDSGLLILALFFYFKPNGRDRFRIIKICFTIITIIIFLLLCSPLFLVKLIGKLLKIEVLSNNFIESLISLVGWILVFFVFFNIFFNWGEKYFLNYIPMLYYSMLISIFLSNKICKILFIKIASITVNEDKEKTNHQIELFWNYIILVITIIFKPLDFNNEEINLIFDALFYSSASITLLSKITDFYKTEHTITDKQIIIDSLTAKLPEQEELEKKINLLNSKIDELSEQNRNQNTIISDLNKQIINNEEKHKFILEKLKSQSEIDIKQAVLDEKEKVRKKQKNSIKK